MGAVQNIGGVDGLGPLFFNVTLAQQPESDVSVAVGLSNQTRGDISHPQLTFTPANWSLPQQVGYLEAPFRVSDGVYASNLSWQQEFIGSRFYRS